MAFLLLRPGCATVRVTKQTAQAPSPEPCRACMQRSVSSKLFCIHWTQQCCPSRGFFLVCGPGAAAGSPPGLWCGKVVSPAGKHGDRAGVSLSPVPDSAVGIWSSVGPREASLFSAERHQLSNAQGVYVRVVKSPERRRVERKGGMTRGRGKGEKEPAGGQ